ncbi:MAG TPA: RpiB/LacA/LacB family sugar-phosphate isomerase, partial [Candidatus Brocadiia bacterium]|nr:RpiB/LacA/LacB family sugar-phosphate isomerase [Candidatus Brocadiia bacterium]
MKVILGSVVKGFKLKQALAAHLKAQGHEILDVGCHDTTRYVKFTSIGQRVAHALQTGAAPLAI